MSLFSSRYFMSQALKEAERAYAEDEVPVGAIVVKNKRIIARAHNQVERLKDPTAHAEILAVTQAASYLGNKWLKGCCLYVTIEPCLMCAYAMILARIEGLFFAASDEKTGAFGSKLDITKIKFNHSLKVKKGIMAAEASSLMKRFFEKKRKQKKGLLWV